MQKRTITVNSDYLAIDGNEIDNIVLSLSSKEQDSFIDPETNSSTQTDLNLGEYGLVVLQTNHIANTLKEIYNIRIEECKQALETIRKNGFNVDRLTQLELKKIFKIKFDPKVLAKRAIHVISENERFKSAIESLNFGDISKLARVLNESNYSLSCNFGVSNEFLDSLIYHARSYKGCIAAKITGDLFGESIVALVDKMGIERFIKHVARGYDKDTGLALTGFTTRIGDHLFENNEMVIA